MIAQFSGVLKIRYHVGKNIMILCRWPESITQGSFCEITLHWDKYCASLFYVKIGLISLPLQPEPLIERWEPVLSSDLFRTWVERKHKHMGLTKRLIDSVPRSGALDGHLSIPLHSRLSLVTTDVEMFFCLNAPKPRSITGFGGW